MLLSNRKYYDNVLRNMKEMYLKITIDHKKSNANMEYKTNIIFHIVHANRRDYIYMDTCILLYAFLHMEEETKTNKFSIYGAVGYMKFKLYSH